MPAALFKFEPTGKFEGVTSWWIKRDGVIVGEMDKQRPWKPGQFRLQVRDRSKPYTWTAHVGSKFIDIPDGSTAREAKVIIIAACS